MSGGRLLFHVVWADFLERTRRYGFLIALGLMIVVAYLFVPPSGSSYITIDLDGYRGVYNSAWIGSAVAMLAAGYLGLFSFYVVKGSISRDRDTGVGQIIATTPISKTAYIFGKWLSNYAVLTAMLLILVVASGVMLFVRGEASEIDIGILIAPFLMIALPTWAAVAALAVLFDTIKWLRGGFGNVVYFFFYLLTFFTLVVSGSGVISAMEDGVQSAVPGHSGKSSCCMVFEANAEQVLGRELGVQQTFTWDGMAFTSASFRFVAVMIGAAIGIVLLSLAFFRGFDPAHEVRRAKQPRLVGILKMPSTLLGVREPKTGTDPETTLVDVDPSQLTILPAESQRNRIGTIAQAELRLAFKGRSIGWYVVAAALVVAPLIVSSEIARDLLPWAWVWPLLIWSSMGVREARHRTSEVVFSTPHPISRQLPAIWVAGFVVAAVAGIGVLVRLLLEGDASGVLVWVTAALFIPSMALAFGSWTGTSKTFEIAYLSLWYIGPMQGIDQFNFIGLDSPNTAAAWTFLIAALLLGLFAVVGRQRQIRH